MTSPPTAEGLGPRSGFLLRMEATRREDRYFYCHQCGSPFSLGGALVVSSKSLPLRVHLSSPPASTVFGAYVSHTIAACIPDNSSHVV